MAGKGWDEEHSEDKPLEPWEKEILQEASMGDGNNTEAPPYSEEECRRDAEEAWEQNTHDMNK